MSLAVLLYTPKTLRATYYYIFFIILVINLLSRSYYTKV